MNNKVLFLLFCLVVYGAYHHFQQRQVAYGVGEIAPNDPVQSETNAVDIHLNGFTLTPLATYTIKARVLSIQNYSFGVEAEISPTDLALGWGPMSNELVMRKIDFSQGNRFFFWHVDSFPIPKKEIETHSANTHIIPSNDKVRRQLRNIRLGQVIEIRGYLIEAKLASGWHWRSSLSREDTGAGACELIYVTELDLS